MSNTLVVNPAASAASAPLQALVATRADWSATIARVVLGAVMLPHGLQKAFGLFGGYGFEGTMGYLTGTIGLPAVAAFLVIFAESAGAVALIVGVLGRLAAAGIAAIMAGAVVTVHGANGFFMNWAGTQAGEGFEYHLLMLGLAAVVIVSGSGAASLDRALSARD